MIVFLFVAKSYLNNSVEMTVSFTVIDFGMLHVFNPSYWWFWCFPLEIHVGKKLQSNRICLVSHHNSFWLWTWKICLIFLSNTFWLYKVCWICKMHFWLCIFIEALTLSCEIIISTLLGWETSEEKVKFTFKIHFQSLWIMMTV